MQKLAAYSIIEANAARNLLHVGAHALGEIRDLVDKSNLGGQKGVAAYLISSAVRRPVYIIGAMGVEDQLRDRPKKVEALYFGAAAAERDGAEAAAERLKAKFERLRNSIRSSRGPLMVVLMAQ
jgi:hypothetical protein